MSPSPIHGQEAILSQLGESTLVALGGRQFSLPSSLHLHLEQKNVLRLVKLTQKRGADLVHVF